MGYEPASFFNRDPGPFQYQRMRAGLGTGRAVVLRGNLVPAALSMVL